MKFQCDRCKTRYSIADEKVRGKVLKIRCKNCSSIITVREGAPSEVKPGGKEPAPAKSASAKSGVALTGPAPRVAQPRAPVAQSARSGGVLGKAFDKAMSAPPPQPDEDDDELPGEQTHVAETPMPLLVDEWYLSVDGSQDGPFSLTQAQQRVAEMPLGEEMHAWRDGFDDWLPVDKVVELAPHVAKPPRRVGPPAGAERLPLAASVSKTFSGIGAAPLSTPTSKPPPSALEDFNTPIPLSELAAKAAGLSGPVAAQVPPRPVEGGAENGEQKRPGEFDFVVGEASQMVQLSHLNGARGPAAIVTRTTPNNGLPSIGRGTGNTASFAALPMSAVATATTTAPSAVAVTRKKKSHVAVILAAGVAAAGILAVLLYLGFRNRAGVEDDDADTGGTAQAGGSEVIDNFYQGGGLPGSNVPSGKPATGGEPTDPDKTAASTGPKRPVIRGNNPTQTIRPAQGGKQDYFTGEDEPEQVTVDDILDKGKIANPAMKQCYNRALKNDPMLKLTRMDLRITVGTSGLVTEVRPMTNASKSKVLTDCLVGIVKGWRFRKSREGLTADLPIIFSNG